MENVFIQYWLIFCERCYMTIFLGFVDLVKENIAGFWYRMGYRCMHANASEEKTYLHRILLLNHGNYKLPNIRNQDFYNREIN